MYLHCEEKISSWPSQSTNDIFADELESVFFCVVLLLYIYSRSVC